MLQKIKNSLHNVYLEVSPYLSMDIVGSALATLIVFYITVMAIFSL